MCVRSIKYVSRWRIQVFNAAYKTTKGRQILDINIKKQLRLKVLCQVQPTRTADTLTSHRVGCVYVCVCVIRRDTLRAASIRTVSKRRVVLRYTFGIPRGYLS